MPSGRIPVSPVLDQRGARRDELAGNRWSPTAARLRHTINKAAPKRLGAIRSNAEPRPVTRTLRTIGIPALISTRVTLGSEVTPTGRSLANLAEQYAPLLSQEMSLLGT